MNHFFFTSRPCSLLILLDLITLDKMASTQKRVSTNMLLNTSLYNLDLWLNNKGFFGKDLKQLKSGLCVGSILCCDMGATDKPELRRRVR